MTPERLGVWIAENSHESRVHTEEVPLTEEQKIDFAQKITRSTAAIYELQDIKAEFENTLKSGTLFQDGNHTPMSYTIPPTKGLKALEANRQYYNRVLKQGFLENKTDLFGIAWVEGKRVVFVDGAGKYYYDEAMKEDKSKELNAEAQLFPPETAEE